MTPLVNAPSDRHSLMDNVINVQAMISQIATALVVCHALIWGPTSRLMVIAPHVKNVPVIWSQVLPGNSVNHASEIPFLTPGILLVNHATQGKFLIMPAMLVNVLLDWLKTLVVFVSQTVTAGWCQIVITPHANVRLVISIITEHANNVSGTPLKEMGSASHVPVFKSQTPVELFVSTVPVIPSRLMTTPLVKNVPVGESPLLTTLHASAVPVPSIITVYANNVQVTPSKETAPANLVKEVKCPILIGLHA